MIHIPKSTTRHSVLCKKAILKSFEKLTEKNSRELFKQSCRLQAGNFIESDSGHTLQHSFFFQRILLHILLLRTLISSLSYTTSITLFRYIYQNQMQINNLKLTSDHVISDEYIWWTSNNWDEQQEKQLGVRNLYDTWTYFGYSNRLKFFYLTLICFNCIYPKLISTKCIHPQMYIPHTLPSASQTISV